MIQVFAHTLRIHSSPTAGNNLVVFHKIPVVWSSDDTKTRQTLSNIQNTRHIIPAYTQTETLGELYKGLPCLKHENVALQHKRLAKSAKRTLSCPGMATSGRDVKLSRDGH